MSTGKAFAVNLAPTFAPTPSISLAPAMHALGHAAAAAAPIVAGAAAAAGAVFLTRAALRGLADLGEKFETDVKARHENRAAAIAWEEAFAEVFVRNSRITRLRGLATTVRDAPAPPQPFVYNGQSMTELATWCAETDHLLRQAEQQLSDARILAALEQPVSAPARMVFERVKRTLVDRGSAPTAPPQPGPAGGGGPVPVRGHEPMDLRPTVDAILKDAAGTISGEDLAALAEQAAEVLAQDRRSAAKAHLDQLLLMVHEARVDQARRERDSEAAAKWLIALAPLAEQPEGMTAHQRKVLARLEAVVAERRELDDELRKVARGLVRVATRAAADRAISETFARELALMGYDVRVSHGEHGAPEHLHVTHAEWDGCHAEIDVHAGDLKAAFRTDASAEQAGRVDLHVAEWAGHVADARRRTAEAGVRSGKLVMVGHPTLPDDRVHPDDEVPDDVPATPSARLRERPTPQ